MSSPRQQAMSPTSASEPAMMMPGDRLKALMAAAADDTSDSEASPSPRKPSAAPNADMIPVSKLDFGYRISSPSANMSDADDTEDEEVVIKPRGRMATRMAAERSDSENEQINANETARERLRRMMIAAKSQPAAGTTENTTAEVDDEIGEEEVVTSVSRKRKMRQGRVSSPTRSPSKTRDASPEGMFVSPAPSNSAYTKGDASGSDKDELPANPTSNARFMALVEKKRHQRLAKEAEIAAQKKAAAALKAKNAAMHSDMLEEDELDSDDDAERELTQKTRPQRKASKRAEEEMHRETQRMARNMLLPQKVAIQKKITKSSLFAKFNYKPAGFEEESELPRPSSSSSAGPEDTVARETPPTSPVSQHGDVYKALTASMREEEEEDLPSLEEALSSQIVTSSSPHGRIDKGKGKAVQIIETSEPTATAVIPPKTIFTQRPIRIVPPKLSKASKAIDDSDSDLEIVTAKTPVRKSKKESIFDRIPAQQARESHSLHALRMLAHITSPGKQTGKKKVRPSMTATELQISLQQRARQQAAREREERLQGLRDRGIIVQSAEERQQEMAEVEDLIAKARREGEEIAKGEKDAAKRERKANGEVDPLGDSSDDEDWEEEKANFAEQMSASGSEDEGDDEAGMSEEEEDEDGDEEHTVSNGGVDLGVPTNALIDGEASESENDDKDAEIDDEVGDFINDDEEEIEEDLPIAKPRRIAKHLAVISDDEDDEPVLTSPLPLQTDSPTAGHSDSPVAPQSVLRSATKTFIPGLTVAGPAGLGLTQIFAGTMDDSQPQTFDQISPTPNPNDSQQIDTAQDSLAFLRNLPPPQFPTFEPTMDDDSQDVVKDSQTQISQIPGTQQEEVSQIQLNFDQSQVHGFDIVLDPTATQLSEYPEPTQDGGFQYMSPIKGRFAEPPPSTVETVILAQTSGTAPAEESPVVKRKGKLRRRVAVPTLSDDEQEASIEIAGLEDDDMEITANIFDVMRNATKKKAVVDDFDKKKSKAKEMVHEQAEESEDEYAGLGGASDDESAGEEDALVQAMIDDEAGKDLDEGKLAAFYADKARAQDEKDVEKLFNDISKGMLRRKRGADYDLSDSDDDGEARRRMKRKEFAKMRKALLADERIGKIAENPKRQAFLRAIEDRGEEDEMDFLDEYVDENEADSQSQSQPTPSQQDVTQVNDSQPDTSMGPPKRKLPADEEAGKRLPPHLRRTQPTKRPSNLSEIRESLSSLIEEPNSIAPTEESDSESENENEGEDTDNSTRSKDKENRDPFASRRSKQIAVVDRISLKRANSSTSSSSTRLAFATSASAAVFKVPALLRRATTNSSITSATSTSSGGSALERTAGTSGSDEFVKKGAGKNSGVHYFARETERRAKVVEGEKRREERRFKGAEGRRKVVGGLFGGGKFE